MTHAQLKPAYVVTAPTPGEDADKITHELMLAATQSGAELNYHASHALYYLQNRLGSKGPDLQRALCLLAALDGVRAPLLCEFTQPAERVLALAALDAARLFVGLGEHSALWPGDRSWLQERATADPLAAQRLPQQVSGGGPARRALVRHRRDRQSRRAP